MSKIRTIAAIRADQSKLPKVQQLMGRIALLELSQSALLTDNRRLRKANRGLRRIIHTLRHVTHP